MEKRKINLKSVQEFLAFNAENINFVKKRCGVEGIKCNIRRAAHEVVRRVISLRELRGHPE